MFNDNVDQGVKQVSVAVENVNGTLLEVQTKVLYVVHPTNADDAYKIIHTFNSIEHVKSFLDKYSAVRDSLFMISRRLESAEISNANSYYMKHCPCNFFLQAGRKVFTHMHECIEIFVSLGIGVLL